MSAFVTLRITRSEARSFLLRQICGCQSDEQMERMMDEYLRDRLYNVRIVNDDDGNDDNLL